MLEKAYHKTAAFTGTTYAGGLYRNVWFAISPEPPESQSNDKAKDRAEEYLDQLRSILDQLRNILRSNDLENNVITLNVFLADIGMKQLIRRELRHFFDSGAAPTQTPVTIYIPQTPADGSLLVVSGVAVGGEVVRIGLAYREESITFDINGVKWCYIGDVTPDEVSLGAHDRAFWAFQRLEQVLHSRNMNVDHLVRTWLYQGHLTLEEDGIERYKELNRARTTFFEGRAFMKSTLPAGYDRAVYPASTGIGADDGDITVGALALQTKRDDVLTVPLENPNQTAAADYNAQYSPKSPKFARAVAVCYDGACHISISGTASITDSETRFQGDAEAQTRQTLDNIERLIDGANLQAHGIDGFDASLDEVVLYRVYVKRPADYEKIRAICEQRIPNTPAVFTIADVCRSDLLVEIEGVAVARKKV